MSKTFRLSRRLLYYLVPGLIFLGGVPWISISLNDGAVFLFSWTFVLLLIAIFSFLEINLWRLIITEDHITLRSTFSNRTLILDEIKGYRQLPMGIVLEAKSPRLKPMKIGLQMEHADEFCQWVHSHFQDLNLLDEGEWQTEIASDEVLGATEYQRKSKIEDYTRLCGVLAVIGFFLLVGSLFSPHVFWPALLLPFACYFIIIQTNGWVTIELKKGKGSSNLTLAMITCGPVVGLTAGIHTPDLVDWKPLLPWLLLSASLIFLPLIFLLKKYGQLKQGLFSLIILAIIFAAPYGAGVAVYTNYHLNKPPLDIYRTIITDKYISRGERTTHYLDFQPVGPLQNTTSYEVGERTYDYYKAGDSVTVAFGKGALGAVWYVLGK